jgi:predicted transcriptional regulator
MIFMENRNQFDIIADILQSAKEGASKREIISLASLNYRQFDAYIPYIMERGFLEKKEETYKVKDKGFEFLRAHRDLKDTMKA